MVTGETGGPAFSAAFVARPQKLFSAFSGVAALAVVPSSVALSAPKALSVRFERVIVDAAPPISRTPAACGRLALFVAEFGVGAPVPWTRLALIVVSEIATDEPAVTRTPSCPKVGPTVVGVMAEQLPGRLSAGVAPTPPRMYGGGVGELKAVHCVRPTIWLPMITPEFTTGSPVSGGVSPVAESIRTPILL